MTLLPNFLNIFNTSMSCVDSMIGSVSIVSETKLQELRYKDGEEYQQFQKTCKLLYCSKSTDLLPLSPSTFPTMGGILIILPIIGSDCFDSVFLDLFPFFKSSFFYFLFATLVHFGKIYTFFFMIIWMTIHQFFIKINLQLRYNI